MDPDQVSSLINTIVTGVMLVSGVVGTIWAGIKALMSAKTEEELRKEQRRNELEQQEEKLQRKLDDLRRDFQAEMERKNKELVEALAEARREETILRESGVKLIEAIEAGIRAREEAPYRRTACLACLVQDQALMAKLREVESFFRKGDSNG